VLATNVAETSLTVPGLHYVIDPGTARIRGTAADQGTAAAIEPISQASPGKGAAVWPLRRRHLHPAVLERDFEGRPEFSRPEILRTNLASVICR